MRLSYDLRVGFFVGAHKSFAGSQRSLALMMGAMEENGVSGLALFPGEGRAREELAEKGFATRIVKSSPVFGTFGGSLQAWQDRRRLARAGLGLAGLTIRVAGVLREERVDVVHANDFRALFLCGWAARLLRLPLVWHVRGELTAFAGTKYMRAAQMLRPEVVAVAKNVETSVPDGLRVRTIYDGVERVPGGVSATPRVSQLLNDGGFKRSGLKLITASSFTPYKGLHHIVEALQRCFRRKPGLRQDVSLFMLGDTTSADARAYREELEYRAERLGVRGNVFLVGWQPNPLEWISACDVLVLPTIFEERFAFHGGEVVTVRSTEGLPRVILDAFRAGKPAIASDVAGVCELVCSGREGIVVEPGSAEALAGAVSRLGRDRRLLRELSKNAERAAEDYSVERMSGEFASLYRELEG